MEYIGRWLDLTPRGTWLEALDGLPAWLGSLGNPEGRQDAVLVRLSALRPQPASARARLIEVAADHGAGHRLTSWGDLLLTAERTPHDRWRRRSGRRLFKAASEALAEQGVAFGDEPPVEGFRLPKERDALDARLAALSAQHAAAAARSRAAALLRRDRKPSRVHPPRPAAPAKPTPAAPKLSAVEALEGPLDARLLVRVLRHLDRLPLEAFVAEETVLDVRGDAAGRRLSFKLEAALEAVAPKIEIDPASPLASELRLHGARLVLAKLLIDRTAYNTGALMAKGAATPSTGMMFLDMPLAAARTPEFARLRRSLGALGPGSTVLDFPADEWLQALDRSDSPLDGFGRAGFVLMAGGLKPATAHLINTASLPAGVIGIEARGEDAEAWLEPERLTALKAVPASKLALRVDGSDASACLIEALRPGFTIAAAAPARPAAAPGGARTGAPPTTATHGAANRALVGV